MIRRAVERDIPKIEDLLLQVCLVHHNGRPDIFKAGRKYSADELREIIRDENRPILVFADEADEVLGYCFCIYQQHIDSSVMTDIKTLYIDDLCVDEKCRDMHIGRALYEAAVALAVDTGCYNLTLNVWSCNTQARRFYEVMGLKPQKIGMELVL